MLSLDSARARGRLLGRPRLSIAQGLQWTVEWYRTVAGGASALAMTEAQIDRYVSMGDQS